MNKSTDISTGTHFYVPADFDTPFPARKSRKSPEIKGFRGQCRLRKALIRFVCFCQANTLYDSYTQAMYTSMVSPSVSKHGITSLSVYSKPFIRIYSVNALYALGMVAKGFLKGSGMWIAAYL